MSVADIYYVQPLLRPLAASFAVSDALAGLPPVITMVGYAPGLLLVMPILERAGLHRLMRRLNVGRLIALALAASATGYVFAAASVLLGATSASAQTLMPAAASPVPWEAVGRTTARITAGLFGGIVGARVIAGALDGLLVRRSVYVLSTLVTLVVHLALGRLPEPPVRHGLGSRALPETLLPPLRSERGLRQAALTATTGFAAFNVFRTAVTPYVTPARRTAGRRPVRGCWGLVGAVRTATVPATGRFLGRGRSGASPWRPLA
ncbi:MFS transporter [Streptomyces sp. NPDC102462]|uniref:MFS transporter n=1 Tax=Streptomyces sp. NPDC102462 TaxID=3366178 RepID=UPI00381715F4